MTLPSSPPISLSDVANELGKSQAGFQMYNSYTRALAANANLPFQMSQFLGRTGKFSGNIACVPDGIGNLIGTIPTNTFFGIQLINISCPIGGGSMRLTASNVPYWGGSVRVTNVSTGGSVLMPVSSFAPSSYAWLVNAGNVMRQATDNYLIVIE